MHEVLPVQDIDKRSHGTTEDPTFAILKTFAYSSPSLEGGAGPWVESQDGKLILSSSRIKSLLRSNDPLLEVEKADLRELVHGSHSALAALDQQIIEAHQALDSLIQKRQTAQSDIKDAKILLHPIRSVPDDVLSEIFQHCAGIFLGSPDSLDLCNCPWTLSYISRRWRDLSLSLPRLWTSITVDFRQYEALSMRTIVTRVALILERSMNMDLFVALWSKRTISDHPAFALLDLSARRWKRLAVCIPQSCLQALSGTSFIRLQELFVSRPNGDTVVAPVTTFRTTSSLRSVAMLSDQTSDSFPLPWSTIETYVCCSFTRADWDCLKDLTALKTLQLRGRKQGTAYNLSELPQITLPTLTSLHVVERCGLDAGIAAKLFKNSSLVLPSLSTLDIHFLRDSTLSFPPSHLLKSLTTLVIRDSMHRVANTGPVLQFLETVAHGLTVQPGKDAILPNLCLLQLQGHLRHFPDPVLLDFLESRCRKDSDGGGLGAANEEIRDASRCRPVFLEEIDLSEVQLVPQYISRLDDLRQRMRIIYTW
ncbi:uncharacterized protein ARMOST_18297 [Armillaria ostoyae]|uniref:F-box domain-containing protein n=1 Tax=Armillaria ostoyae TaxID=47428 RepID=A0A284S1H5_ARMOS|nr:uncharacterized protein ARMOST_18297 [Armillaria ostoyae]